MKIETQINQDAIKSINMKMTIEMTVEHWLLIKDALDKGKRGYFGPEIDLVDGIKNSVNRYRERIENTYVNELSR